MSDTALRLAERIDFPSVHCGHEAAVELRRLHAENEALREANESFGKRQEWWNEKMFALEALNSELVEALKWIGDHDLKGCDLVVAGYMAHGFIDRARAALSKAGVSNG